MLRTNQKFEVTHYFYEFMSSREKYVTFSRHLRRVQQSEGLPKFPIPACTCIYIVDNRFNANINKTIEAFLKEKIHLH